MRALPVKKVAVLQLISTPKMMRNVSVRIENIELHPIAWNVQKL